MSRNLGLKAGWLVLAAAAIAMVVVPAAEATTVKYNFTVDVTSGPLSGQVDNGSFSYDSSSITPGAINQQLGLLTAFNFAFNGTTYNASSGNTGWLGFDAAGNLYTFNIGNNCYVDDPTQPENCIVTSGSDQWFVTPSSQGFGYSTPETNAFFTGGVTYALADSLKVPEPGALGMFGLGALLIGLFAGLRRRMC